MVKSQSAGSLATLANEKARKSAKRKRRKARKENVLLEEGVPHVELPQRIHRSASNVTASAMPLRKDSFWPETLPSPASASSSKSGTTENRVAAAETPQHDTPTSTPKKNKRPKRKKTTHLRMNSLLDENSIFSPPMQLDDSQQQDPFIEWNSKSKKRKLKMQQRREEQGDQQNGNDIQHTATSQKHAKKEPQDDPTSSITSISTSSTPTTPIPIPFQQIETAKQLKTTIEYVAQTSDSEYRSLQWKEWINNLRDPSLEYLNELQQVVSFRDVFLESKTLEYIVQSILRDPVDREEESILWELFTQTLMSDSDSFYTNLINSLHQIHLRIRDEPENIKSQLMQFISHDIIASIKQNSVQHRRVTSNLDQWNAQISETRHALYRKKDEMGPSGGAVDGGSIDTLHIYANLVNLFEKKCVTLLESQQAPTPTHTPTSSSSVNPFGAVGGLHAKDKLDVILEVDVGGVLPSTTSPSSGAPSLATLTKQKTKAVNKIDASIAKVKNSLKLHNDTLTSLSAQQSHIESEIARLQAELASVNTQLIDTRTKIESTQQEKRTLFHELHEVTTQFDAQIDTLYAHSLLVTERNSTKRVIMDLITNVENTYIGAYKSRKSLFEKKMIISVQQYWNMVEEYADMLAKSAMQLAQLVVSSYEALSLQHEAFENAAPDSPTRRQILTQYKQYERQLAQWNNVLADARRLRKSVQSMIGFAAPQNSMRSNPSLPKIKTYLDRVKQTEALKKSLVVEFGWILDE